MNSIPRFWRNMKSRYNLIGRRCRRCGRVYFPPRNLCPNCRRRSELEDFKLNGRGEVVSYTVIHTPPEGFDRQAPYIMALVKLEEGAMVTAQIVDVSLEEVKIGMKVESVFRKIQEDGEAGLIYYGFKFRPAKEE
ncbi:Zn-ribbon domain-containing OB-fold protein [Candidatus Pyrohabitans sp.]